MKINRTQTPIYPGQRSSKNQGQVIRFRTAAILLRAIVGILFLLFYIPAGAEDPPESAYGSLVITWAGVIDNGEGDEPPHGPYGSLHVLIYEEDAGDPEDQFQYPEPLSHAYLSGPTTAGGEKREWLDGDEKAFENLEVFRWRKPDDAVTLLVYESDPSTATFNFLDTTFRLEMKRKHDRLFFARVSRMDTLASPVTLSSADVRLACGDALEKLRKSETAGTWVRRMLERLRNAGDGAPAMLVSLDTVASGEDVTRNYR